MEFDQPKGASQSPDIDDATRLAATQRKLTVEPVNDAITPEDISDEQVATMHVTQPAISNLAIDSEATPSSASTGTTTKHSPGMIIGLIVAVFAVMVITGVLVFMFI